MSYPLFYYLCYKCTRYGEKRGAVHALYPLFERDKKPGRIINTCDFHHICTYWRSCLSPNRFTLGHRRYYTPTAIIMHSLRNIYINIKKT